MRALHGRDGQGQEGDEENGPRTADDGAGEGGPEFFYGGAPGAGSSRDAKPRLFRTPFVVQALACRLDAISGASETLSPGIPIPGLTSGIREIVLRPGQNARGPMIAMSAANGQRGHSWLAITTPHHHRRPRVVKQAELRKVQHAQPGNRCCPGKAGSPRCWRSSPTEPPRGRMPLVEKFQIAADEQQRVIDPRPIHQNQHKNPLGGAALDADDAAQSQQFERDDSGRRDAN